MFWDPDLYNQTLKFAAMAHHGQTLPGSELSYLVHLSQVCQEALGAVVADPTMDARRVMCCALLHDTIEDTDTTHTELSAQFGTEIADGVLALSKRKTIGGRALDKDAQMADSLERIRLQPREVWAVKLADRITNLQTPPKHWNQAKIHRYHAEAQTILDALGTSSAYLQSRFQQKLADYHQHFE